MTNDYWQMTNDQWQKKRPYTEAPSLYYFKYLISNTFKQGLCFVANKRDRFLFAVNCAYEADKPKDNKYQPDDPVYAY